MPRPSGGWISGYTAPTTSAARGVWSLRDSYHAQAAGIWPIGLTVSTQLLLHFNGANNGTTFTDSSLAARTVTRVGTPVISTSASKFGGASGSFPGGANYLTVADSDSLELRNSNFAIEFWMRTTTSAQYSSLVSRVPTSNASGTWNLLMNFASATAGDVAFFANNVNGGSAVVSYNGTSIRDGAWHHIALSRNGTTFGLYVDGTRSSTFTSSATIANIAGDIYIAREQATGFSFTGNLDELRIMIGTAGPWTGTSVTLPTAEY